MSLRPEDDSLRLSLAGSYYHANKPKKVIQILQKLPDDPAYNLDVICLLGSCFMSQNKFDLAIEVFKRAPLQKRNLDEKLTEIHFNLAIALENSGAQKDALKHYKKVYAKAIDYRDVADRIERLTK